MVSVSGPISAGILAGRPCGLQSVRQQHGGADECGADVKIAENTIRHKSDLYVRPSWTDAAVALDQLEKVKNLNLPVVCTTNDFPSGQSDLPLIRLTMRTSVTASVSATRIYA